MGFKAIPGLFAEENPRMSAPELSQRD